MRSECLPELVALSDERSLGGRWQVFAAEQLAEIDPRLGLAALARITRDRTAGARWRLRALVVGFALARTDDPGFRDSPSRGR